MWGWVLCNAVVLLMSMPICYILMVVQRSLRVPQWHFILLVMSDSFHAHALKSNILGSYSVVRAAVGPTASQLVLCRGDPSFVVPKGCLPVQTRTFSRCEVAGYHSSVAEDSGVQDCNTIVEWVTLSVLKYYIAFILMDQAISQLWKKCGITHNSGTGLWMAAEGSVGYCSGTAGPFRRWKHCYLSKCLEPLTQQHTSQKMKILSLQIDFIWTLIMFSEIRVHSLCVWSIEEYKFMYVRCIRCCRLTQILWTFSLKNLYVSFYFLDRKKWCDLCKVCLYNVMMIVLFYWYSTLNGHYYFKEMMQNI